MTITYNNYMTKLDTIIESAMLELELECLTEAADVDEKSDGKVKISTKIKNILRAIIRTVIKALKAFGDWVKTVIAKFAAMLKDAAAKFVVAKDFSVYSNQDLNSLVAILQVMENMGIKYLAKVKVDGATVEKLNGKIKDFAFGAEKEYSIGDKLDRKTVELWKATGDKFLKWDAAFVATLEDLEATFELAGFDATPEAMKETADIINTALALMRDAYGKISVAASSVRAISSKPMKMKDIDNVDAKPTVQEESATALRIKKVKLLIEAANELDALEFKSGDGIEIEEKPEDANEYPDDASGGEGEEIDFEELKDIIGDDEEALAIMTDDGDSVTIDFEG